jgi:uncharacterized membrane protein
MRCWFIPEMLDGWQAADEATTVLVSGVLVLVGGLSILIGRRVENQHMVCGSVLGCILILATKPRAAKFPYSVQRSPTTISG